MPVTIHQALHGYSEGHRQLACSTSLHAKDTRLLLVMSDVAGPGVAGTGVSYLTGYPLAESGVYALSMTWPAPEMPRPGCVWTHTLLISFADLAVMDVPSALSALFSRPRSQNVGAYHDAVTVDFSAPFREQLDVNGARCVALLASALYGRPNEQIWSRRPQGVDVDDAVLRLWDQQWPRLRRSFKFCTLTSRDRSFDSLQFDLQLTLGGNSSAQLRLASNLEGFEAVAISDELWLADLVRDAAQPSKSSLRQMLRALGSDLLGGREAMSPICTLHAALEAGSPQALGAAVSLATEEPPLSSSDLAKGVVLRAVLASKQPLESTHVLNFLLEHFGLLPSADAIENADRFAQMVWQADPRTFVIKSYDGAEPTRLALRRGGSSIALGSVLKSLPELADVAEPLLHLFPELARDQRFWAQTQSWPSSVASMGIDISGPSALRAIVTGLQDERAIGSALHIAGTPAVLACLEDLLHQGVSVPQIQGWIRQSCVDVHGVASFISHHGRQSRELLLHIAGALSPDAVPNDYGDDPWALALDSLRAAEGKLPIELCAYGFRRALGWRSRSVQPLLRLTFEPLHDAALMKAIPAASWSLLDGSLPWVSHNESWDNGLKLRRAAARKCVDLPVDPKGFVELVGSDQLFLGLMDAVWQLWSGGRYLRAVKDWLNQNPDARYSNQRKLLKRFIKERSFF